MKNPRIKILHPHSSNCPNNFEDVPRLFIDFDRANIEYRDSIGRLNNGGHRWAGVLCNHTKCLFRAVVSVRDLENIVEELIALQEKQST